MFSTLPQSVCDEGWESWESQRMKCEDIDVSDLPIPAEGGSSENSDSEMSCLSDADSPTTKERKLAGQVYGTDSNKMAHLHAIKQTPQRYVDPCHSRNSDFNQNQ